MNEREPTWSTIVRKCSVISDRGELLLNSASTHYPDTSSTYASHLAVDGATQPTHYPARQAPETETQPDLASWLLAREIAGGGETADLTAAAVEQICQKFLQRLSRLVSTAGSQALLSRALHLARLKFPLLASVAVGSSPDACFKDVGQDIDNTDAAEALFAVFRILLNLLVGFIGEDLTLRLVREAWPDVPSLKIRRLHRSDGREAAS